jgi:hypothetical protein
MCAPQVIPPVRRTCGNDAVTHIPILGPVVLALLGFNCCLSEPQLPEVADISVKRAQARGADAPDPRGLRRAVLAHVVARPTSWGGAPTLVCVRLPDPRRPSEPWHPDALDVEWLQTQGVAVSGDWEACMGKAPGSMLVWMTPIERWWSDPNEYEVPTWLLYRGGDGGPYEEECITLIAVHRTQLWVVTSEETSPGRCLY